MKKIFLVILALPLLSFAEGDPNLVFQSGGASSTALGTTATKPCPMCKHQNKVRLGTNTNALPGAKTPQDGSDTSGVNVGQ